MIFTDIEERQKEDLGELWYLDNYFPYWDIDGTRNQSFNSHSGRILDLKERNTNAINHFFNTLDPLINNNVTICVVPSSNSGKIESGIRDLAQMLANSNHRIDATRCLRRHTTIPKAAHGGPRSIQAHLDSICVEDKHLIIGKEVLLLDDVATSESSINACEQLLIAAGAKKVVKLVLGCTTR